MDPRSNLLVRLHKWASRQDENFLTEAFAHLLAHLLENEPAAAVGLLSRMSSGFFQLQPQDAKHVSVRTQIVTGEGTPDIEIRTPHQLTFVEVKVESDVNKAQIRNYRRLLKAGGVSATHLILLTRYPVIIDSADERPDTCIRWYQVADWIEEETWRYTFKPVSEFLVNQLLSFLALRNMTMGQVTFELSGGVRALRNLMDMLYEAAASSGVRVKYSGSPSWSGYTLDGSNYWVGIYFTDPDTLVFETWQRFVNKEAAEQLGIGEVQEKERSQWGWSRNLPLQSEDVHFYSRSKASQMQLLEEFIRESLDLAHQIELPQQSSDENLAAGPELN